MFVFGEVFVAKRDEEHIICLYTNDTKDSKQDVIYLKYYFRRLWRHKICRYQYVVQYILWT